MRWATGVLTTLPLAVVVIAAGPASDLRPELRNLVSVELKFSAADLADLEKGKVVTHGLGAAAAGEIAAVGAVRVKARREAFVNRYRDIVQFKRGADVLQIGRFGDPPTIEDLGPLTLGKSDVDVRTYRVAHCDIRLPVEAIVRFQREIDWAAPDAEARASALFKQMLFDNVRAYLSGGPGRIVEYDDEKRPVPPVDDFLGLLGNSPYLGELVPGLPEHLKAFPSSPLVGAEDFLYCRRRNLV